MPTTSNTPLKLSATLYNIPPLAALSSKPPVNSPIFSAIKANGANMPLTNTAMGFNNVPAILKEKIIPSIIGITASMAPAKLSAKGIKLLIKTPLILSHATAKRSVLCNCAKRLRISSWLILLMSPILSKLAFM